MVSLFLRSGLELQGSRSYVEGFLKDTHGLMKDPRKFKRPPDQTVHGFMLGHIYPRSRKKNAEWAEESAKQQAARRNRGKYKELTW